MSRIDKTEQHKRNCTGCAACIDICPVGCISSVVGSDGFTYVELDESKCLSCGKCYHVCPAENHEKNVQEQHLYAAYSTISNGQNGGSSGGIFELLARYCLSEGYYVCGAAFEELQLKHRIVAKTDDLGPLLKSKYIQSNTEGVFREIQELLRRNQKVFFCGTPCQVSALKNSVSASMRGNLVTADIICHGVPSQKSFDMYIQSLERRHGGQVKNFSFRVKDNRYAHAHGFSYTLERNGEQVTHNGVYTQSSFYNAFKKYLLFRESCYDCKYATLQRVSDITLWDFWGIEKYDFRGNTDQGVSMILTNTSKGQELFDAVRHQTVNEEYPIAYGVESNFCLTHTTKKPGIRDAVIRELYANGYDKTANKYFRSGWVYRFYWIIPPKLRHLLRKLRG